MVLLVGEKIDPYWVKSEVDEGVDYYKKWSIYKLTSTWNEDMGSMRRTKLVYGKEHVFFSYNGWWAQTS